MMEPIVRSSVGSSASSVIDDSDPVTRDCHALRQRLLETERSLQNLTLKSNKVSLDLDVSNCADVQLDSSNGPWRIEGELYRISCPTSDQEDKESVYQSDNPPVLTLADLTPTNSHNEFDTHFDTLQSEDLFPRNSSMIENKRERSRPSSRRSQRSPTSNNSHHDSLNSSTGSDIDSSTIKRKMTKLRDENVSLFVQNNKLLAELEKTTFQLQESKCQVKELNELIEENQNLKENEYEETIKLLHDQLDNKDYAISELEALVLELRNHLRNHENGDELARLKEKVEENIKTIEELSENCKGYSQREKKLIISNQDLEESKKKNDKKIAELENENSLLRKESGNVKTDNMDIQRQLATLKTELLTLQQKSSQAESLAAENAGLKTLLEEQQNKISDYEKEVSKTKDHMSHLEKLIQKIQEDKLSNSRPDSGLGGAIAELSRMNSCDNDASSQRALVADLQLKLAMKDTEIHKLQVQVASNNLHQQKLKSEFNYEGSTLHDLRAELCAVVEKTRHGDKKQIQLEQQITKLEEDLSGKKCQLIELNERIADKVTLVATLENKLLQRNKRLVELQKELDTSSEKCDKLKEENAKLIAQATENSKKIIENESKLKDLEFKLNNANKSIGHYENIVKSHEEETHHTDSQFENVKLLHAEHCKEYDYQIDNLQQQVVNKSNHVVTLETKMRNLLNEEKKKDVSLKEMKEYVEKMEQLLDEKKNVIEKYKENLESLQEQLQAKCNYITQLESSLEQYKRDLAEVMKEHQDNQSDQENILTAKTNQLETLSASTQILKEELETKNQRINEMEASHNRNIEMLEQSQKRISELEESQAKSEEEVNELKQTLEKDRAKALEESSILTSQLQEDKKQIIKHKNQLSKMSEELNTTRSNHLLTSAKMKEQEVKIINQAGIINKQTEEVDKLKYTTSEIEKCLVEKENEMKRLEGELEIKTNAIETSKDIQRDLTDQLNAAQTHLTDSLKRLSSLEREFKDGHQLKKDEAMKKLERLLEISEEDLCLKEKELSECKERCTEIENVMSEQQWQLKQKAAEFAHLEIAYKNDKSEFEKKIAFLADDINGLKTSISQKDVENVVNNGWANIGDWALIKEKTLLDLTKSNEAYKIREEERTNTVEIYDKKFKVLEEENKKMVLELKELGKELQRCKGEVKNTIAIEEEILKVKQDNKSIIADLHTLENQLMSSQQTVLELNHELSDATAMIKLKEADCTRLARELGASQVREANVTARLNQDLRKVVIEEGLKNSQKNDEIELLRNRINELSSSSQQEILQLKHHLQRSEDEKTLFKHDIERYNAWIKKLEENGKTLNEQLLKEKKKAKSLSESVLLHEAKAARYSTRMSGYKRAATMATSQNTKFSPKSTLHDLTLELDSTISTVPRDSEKIGKNMRESFGKESRDSFENLLKQTAAELDNSIQNTSVNSAPDSSINRNSFNISDFEATT